jgi:hypothetical protein
MWYLYNTQFVYLIAMDGNRYTDGIDLRYRFGDDNNIEQPIIASCLDNNPCSLLEMMVALALRCEEHIMCNPNIGVLSGRWFWKMITNLGLDEMYDSNYDENYVNNIIYRFLDREYGAHGEGNIFYIPNSQYDLRSMDIWYQMMHYLNELE